MDKKIAEYLPVLTAKDRQLLVNVCNKYGTDGFFKSPITLTTLPFVDRPVMLALLEQHRGYLNDRHGADGSKALFARFFKRLEAALQSFPPTETKNAVTFRMRLNNRKFAKFYSGQLIRNGKTGVPIPAQPKVSALAGWGWNVGKNGYVPTQVEVVPMMTVKAIKSGLWEFTCERKYVEDVQYFLIDKFR